MITMGKYMRQRESNLDLRNACVIHKPTGLEVKSIARHHGRIIILIADGRMILARESQNKDDLLRIIC